MLLVVDLELVLREEGRRLRVVDTPKDPLHVRCERIRAVDAELAFLRKCEQTKGEMKGRVDAAYENGTCIGTSTDICHRSHANAAHTFTHTERETHTQCAEKNV
jgi:hypothetical protein